MDTKPKVSLDIFNDIRSLPQEEQYAIARKLMDMLSSPRGGSSYLGDVDVSGFDDDTLVCPHCGGIHVIKKGYANDHITRRYKCMDCGKGFRKTTNSVISFTHKSTDVWERFILMTLRKETLEACTKECGISIATAFSWRHKIMAALADDQSERKLTGIIEMDETFTRISYKGNHKKSKDFKMPRPAYHRGSDNRGKMGDRACVLCAIERGKQVYSAVVCRGSLKAELLEKVLPPHLDESSIVITDGLYAFDKYFKAAPQDHKEIPAKAKRKGVYHLNNVNNYHGRFKHYLRTYRGVSTKYLNNYVALFAWLENARLAAKNSREATVSKVLEYGSYRPYKEFSTWERTPGLASVA